jgi:stage II sporulation protein D
MDRRAFFTLAGAALVGFPRVARATGGLDIAAPESQHAVRVLLASGAFEAPQQIDTWRFAWNGRTYRGAFDTPQLADGRRGLINTLPLDAYLYGVLSKEVSASWAAGAQQAQALVSRTYALLKLRPERDYDVTASEGDQLYGGIESETVEGRAAVDATAGTIVTYGSAPARIAFSACCGGRTADAADVWNTPFPYLASIADPHCPGTPGFAWQAAIAFGSVRNAFGPELAGIGRLRTVDVRADDPTARPRGIDFVGASATFETTPKAFRSALGAGVIRSAFVHGVAVAGSGDDATLTIDGTGHGHGVGLCQWGARVMGSQGSSSSEIVAFYLPGTALGRA